MSRCSGVHINQGTLFLHVLFLIVAAVAILNGDTYYFIMVAAVLVSLGSLGAATLRPRTQLIEILLKWLVRPSVAIAVFVFGYPFAELLNNPSNERMTGLFLCIAFTLAVLSIPRSNLETFLRHQQEIESVRLGSSVRELKDVATSLELRIAALEGAQEIDTKSPPQHNLARMLRCIRGPRRG